MREGERGVRQRMRGERLGKIERNALQRGQEKRSESEKERQDKEKERERKRREEIKDREKEKGM